jgi:hypothetical protein
MAISRSLTGNANDLGRTAQRKAEYFDALRRSSLVAADLEFKRSAEADRKVDL